MQMLYITLVPPWSGIRINFNNNKLSTCQLPPWKDGRIHMLGNHGFLGNIHARIAKKITDIIDEKAYNGKNVRKLLHETSDTVDLGCGIGLSTVPGGIGVDSSKEMLSIARKLHPTSRFERGLAEKWGKDNMASVVVCSFLLHEQPFNRRYRILKNAYRICKDNVLIMDISPDYIPPYSMLMGEPYVKDYLENIDRDIFNLFDEYKRIEIVPGHVILWNITKVGKNSW